jgi:hypothetical protein
VRGPSARVLVNRVSVYVAVSSLDADRAPQYIYPSVPTYGNEPCTIQPMGTTEDTSDQQRVTQVMFHKLIFARQLNLSPRAMITWVDSTGTTRTMFVETDRFDNAGRAAAFTVVAQERL